MFFSELKYNSAKCAALSGRNDMTRFCVRDGRGADLRRQSEVMDGDGMVKHLACLLVARVSGVPADGPSV